MLLVEHGLLKRKKIMNINTKLNVGDTGFFMSNNQIQSAEIVSIRVYCSKSGISEQYIIDINPAGSNYTKCFNADEIYKNKIDLLNTL